MNHKLSDAARSAPSNPAALPKPNAKVAAGKSLKPLTWGPIPPLGDFRAYLTAVQLQPLLTAEEEISLAQQYHDSGDVDAARKLVLSHMRLVVSLARGYEGYGLPQNDLIQEGNVGLMRAVKNFDPARGVRLVTYATYWIRLEIQEYILKNWRIVRLVTTKAQKKLFFKLRSLKQELQNKTRLANEQAAELAVLPHLETVDGVERFGAIDGVSGVGPININSPATFQTPPSAQLTQSETLQIAQLLSVKPEEVHEMEERMSGRDIELEPSPDSTDEEAFAPIHYLADNRMEPSVVLETKQRDLLASEGVRNALAQLDEKSRTIITERWLNLDDDGNGGKTLKELAAVFGVSNERIRQIEVAALKKMRAFMSVMPLAAQKPSAASSRRSSPSGVFAVNR